MVGIRVCSEPVVVLIEQKTHIAVRSGWATTIDRTARAAHLGAQFSRPRPTTQPGTQSALRAKEKAIGQTFGPVSMVNSEKYFSFLFSKCN
jgi:hypothetical protein